MYVDNSQFQNRWVICDLDDTLFSLSPEMLEWVTQKQYDKYNAAVHTGEVVPVVRDLLSILYANGAKICCLTARSEIIREETVKQLMDNRVPFGRLIMRPLDWQHPSTELKPMLIRQFFRLADIALVLEDRDEVTAVLRSLGLTVWQVRKGQY